MGKGLFSTGYDAVKNERKRQEQNSSARRFNKFFLTKDGEEADIQFLTEEPVNCYLHTVKSTRNGKEYYNDVLCTEDCELCAEGDTPSLKSTYLIIDYRPYEYEDKNGKKHKVEKSLKVYTVGTRIASQLDRLSNKYGLVGRTYCITRSGRGTATTYMFDRGDTNTLTKQDIEELLPESVRSKFNGTEDSLHNIIKEYLTSLLPVDASIDSSSEDSPKSSTLVNIDDEDADEEDYSKPSSSPRPSAKKLFNKR